MLGPSTVNNLCYMLGPSYMHGVNNLCYMLGPSTVNNLCYMLGPSKCK